MESSTEADGVCSIMELGAIVSSVIDAVAVSGLTAVIESGSLEDDTLGALVVEATSLPSTTLFEIDIIVGIADINSSVLLGVAASSAFVGVTNKPSPVVDAISELAAVSETFRVGLDSTELVSDVDSEESRVEARVVLGKTSRLLETEVGEPRSSMSDGHTDEVTSWR